MPVQEIDFRGTGLDTDSDLRVMAPGDSDYRLNCILDVSNDSSLGNIQNDWGFVLQNYTQPPGTNEVIGSCKDLQRNAVIYFVWNSLQNHEIRRWYVNTGTTELILRSSILNFQRNYKIFHANVLDDMLLWTDGYQGASEIVYNSPRKINIDKAIGYTNGLPWPQGYTTIDLQTIEAVKYPPLYVPSQTFVTVPNLQSLLVGKYHQFFYRYVYDDNEKSVFSPIASLIISQNEDADGNYTYSVDNAIDVTLLTGHHTVVKIEIGCKINNAYYLIDILEKYDSSGAVLIPSNTTHTYRYFGDRQLGVLNEAEVLKPFDFVPQVANCQEIVLSNTLVYANFIEGLGTPVTNLTSTVKFKKGTNTAPVFNASDYGELIKYRQISFKRGGIYRPGVIYKKTQGYTCPVSSPDTAQVQINWLSDPDLFSPYFDVTDQWILSMNQKPYIEWNLTSIPPIWADSYEIVCTKDLRDLEKTHYFPQWGAALGDEDGIHQNDKTTLLIPSTVGYSFEEGDRIRLVSQYSSLTTLGTVPPLPANLAFGFGTYPQSLIDTYNDSSGIVYDFAIEKFDLLTSRVHIAGQVKNLDPTATYVWEIYNPTRKTTASSDGTQNGEIFYGIGQTYDILNPGQSNRSHSVTTGTIEGIDVFHRWKKMVWKPQRVKFRVDQIAIPPGGFPNCSAVLKETNLISASIFKEAVSTLSGAVLSSLHETKTSAITKGFKDEKYGTSFNGSWSTFNMFFGSSTAPNAGLITNSTIINVLSGNIGGQNAQKILESLFNAENYVSLGNATATTLAGNVNGVINGSDEVTIEFDTRNNINLNEPQNEFNIYMLSEDHSLSDYYESDIDSIGKGYVENSLEVRKRYPTMLRHGGSFFEDTQINNLLSFDSKDFNNKLVDTYNEISRIRYIGYTLNIRQRNKNNSMYIGRQEIQDTAGNIDLLEIPEIFGTINPAIENNGSYHAGSDVKADINSYYYDVTSGEVMRDSVNGQFPISSYKMTNYFRNLAKKIREGGFELIGVWDSVIECYVLTARDIRKAVEGRPNESVTIIFNERADQPDKPPRWKSFMSYAPEWYENIGETTVSFKDGNLWKHYADPNNRNRYYGVNHPQQVAVICNAGYNSKKVFRNIKIDSNVSWDSDITTPPNGTYPLGMKSRLRKEKLTPLEGGGFYGSFMKDMNTPGITNPTLALVNGRELRGEVLRVLLTNNESKLVSLRQVIIYFSQSELTD